MRIFFDESLYNDNAENQENIHPITGIQSPKHKPKRTRSALREILGSMKEEGHVTASEVLIDDVLDDMEKRLFDKLPDSPIKPKNVREL